MKRFLITMVVAAVFMATSAQAAPKGKLYFAGNLGLTIASDSDDFGSSISFDPGFNITGAVGYDIGQIRVEGEIGYRRVEMDSATGFGFFAPIDGEVSTLTFMANGYYDFEINSPLTPYVGFGLGLANTDIEFVIPFFGTVGGSETDIAYQFMVGAGYEIAPNIILTGGYRFLGIADSGAVDFHEFTVGARYMF